MEKDKKEITNTATITFKKKKNINNYENILLLFILQGLFQHGLKMNLCLKSLKRGVDSNVDIIFEWTLVG